MGDFYVPVAIESIETNIFPDVALYLKSGTNYVLYKSHGRDFSQKDAERLMENSVEFLYVSPGDQELINEFMEKNASRLLRDGAVQNRTKGKIIYQTSVNYLGDIFENPDKVGDFERSKRLIENLVYYLGNDKQAISSLELVMTHNYYTFVHSLQVTALSLLLHSEAYLLPSDEMVDVGIGTLLHDFGKIFTPATILEKTGKLTESELAVLRRHPEEGYRFLKEKTGLSEVSLSIVRHHHERNNGNGFPLGLKDPAIPRSAQVAAICDLYCILTTDRNCHKSLQSNFALHIMKNEMKGAFNPRQLGILEELVCSADAEPLLF
ncbi:MAG TPA: HD domain-containing phosphohydrolase [Geobacteraceae bacterium]|nr:HD domain-containing phosphohydrolase [Geobacteraceae bacterium]